MSGLVRYETLNETPATVRIAPVTSPSRRPSGHAPRTARHSTRSTAASGSSGESDDGSSDSSSDDPASPSLPLAYDNIDKRRNKLHSENFHCNELSRLIERLTLGCAGLLAAVLASLIAGATR